MKICGVAVAMPLGQSWAPNRLSGSRVNVGTGHRRPPRIPARGVEGQARRLLWAVVRDGAAVVVAGVTNCQGERESRSQGKGRQRSRQ